MNHRRVRGFSWLVLAACIAAARPAEAEQEPVTAAVAIKLLSKILPHVQGYRGASGPGHVVVVHTSGPDSELFAKQMERAFSVLGSLAEQPHSVSLWQVGSELPLLDYCRQQRATLVYLAPEVGTSLLEGLRKQKLFVVGADPQQVQAGAALGFELVGARPRIVVNVAAAKAAGLVFGEELLNLSRVVTP